MFLHMLNNLSILFDSSRVILFVDNHSLEYTILHNNLENTWDLIDTCNKMVYNSLKFYVYATHFNLLQNFEF